MMPGWERDPAEVIETEQAEVTTQIKIGIENSQTTPASVVKDLSVAILLYDPASEKISDRTSSLPLIASSLSLTTTTSGTDNQDSLESCVERNPNVDFDRSSETTQQIISSFHYSCPSLQGNLNDVYRSSGMKFLSLAEFEKKSDETKNDVFQMEYAEEMARWTSEMEGVMKVEMKDGKTEDETNETAEDDEKIIEQRSKIKNDDSVGKEQAVNMDEVKCNLSKKKCNEEKNEGLEPSEKFGEKNEAGVKAISIHNSAIVSSQMCRSHARESRHLESQEAKVFIALKMRKVDKSFDLINYNEPDAEYDFSDEDETSSRSQIDQLLPGNSKIQQLIQSVDKFWHKAGHSLSGLERLQQNGSTDYDLTSKMETSISEDDIQALEFIVDTRNSGKILDPYIKKDVIHDGDLYRNKNNDNVFSRKRTTNKFFCETTIPAKVGKFETIKVKNDIWSKLEDMCQQNQSNLSKTMDNVKDRQTTLAVGSRVSHSEARLKMKLQQVRGKSMFTKVLQNADILSGKLAQCIRQCINNNTAGVTLNYGNKLKAHYWRSYSSANWSLRSEARSRSGSYKSHFCDFRCSSDCHSHMRPCVRSRFRQHYHSRLTSKHHRGRSSGSTSSSSSSCSRSRSYSRSLSSCQSRCKSLSPDGLRAIKMLLQPLILPASVTTFIVAPVTGSIGGGTKSGGPPDETVTSGQQDTNKKESTDGSLPNTAEKSKPGVKETSLNAHSSTTSTVSTTRSAVGTSKSATGNPGHRHEPVNRTVDQVEDHYEHSHQRYQSGYGDQPIYSHMSYHSSADPYFSEDTGFENFETDGGDYDHFYDEGQDEYNFSHDSYHRPPQRLPGQNVHYSRRHIPQGFRGPPPQMYAPNGPSFGHPRPGVGPPPRMGLNGPRGPRPQMGPRGYRPQFGLGGGPVGANGMRGPSRGSPYGPPRPMRPQGLRGPPGANMMGPTAQIGSGNQYPRNGPPPPRLSSPMPRHSSNTPGGPRPRMETPVSSPLPRDGQYPPPRPSLLPHNLMLNLSQPPPNFNVPPSQPSSTPTSTGNSTKITDTMEPPPLPPPKPPTPKPPPPPKKEEKKEEIKPMTPLIPPEQAEQYRRLREQARKHARKQLRKQEHQGKGEPESSDEDDEEKARKKEYEARLTAEREDMEKAALMAAQDDAAVNFEEGATYLVPANQSGLMQQPAYVIQHHPMSTLPSSYGLVSAPHFTHAGHPALHASQFQNLQFMTQQAQPQLVQLPNGQVVYATPAPMTYQAMGPMVSMSPQGIPSGQVPHQMVLSSGGMHQVPVANHPGIAVSGGHYMNHIMAAQIQAAQAAQVQAAQVQAAQVQAAQAAQVQAAQAAQVQAAQAQAAQVQAAQAAQAQQAQLHGLVPGVHMSQHMIPGMHPQGQIIFVPRVARPQM